MIDRENAQAGLDAITEAERAVANVGKAPRLRHAAFAAVMATIVAATAMPSPYTIALVVVAMAGVVALVQWDRRTTGLFINGYRPGATLPVTIALLVAMLALVLVALRLKEAGHTALSFAPAAVAFVVAYGASRWWERIFLRELGATR